MQKRKGPWDLVLEPSSVEFEPQFPDSPPPSANYAPGGYASMTPMGPGLTRESLFPSPPPTMPFLTPALGRARLNASQAGATTVRRRLSVDRGLDESRTAADAGPPETDGDDLQRSSARQPQPRASKPPPPPPQPAEGKVSPPVASPAAAGADSSAPLPGILVLGILFLFVAVFGALFHSN